MTPGEILSDRILILLELFPEGFRGDNILLSVILNEDADFISQIVQEMVETGLVERSFDREAGCRVLQLENSGENEKMLSKEESKQRRNTFYSSYIYSSYKVLLLLRSSSPSSSEKYRIKSDDRRSSVDVPRVKENEEDLIREERQAKPLPSKEKVIIPGVVAEIIEYWNNTGLSKCNMNRNTVTLNKVWTAINKLRAGTLYINTPDLENRVFTQQEIFLSIRRFSLACLDPKYEPSLPYLKQAYSKLKINEFLLNPYSRMEHGKSLFQYYLKSEPELVANKHESLIEDKFPKISSSLKSHYLKKYLPVKNPKLLNREENKFRLGAERLRNFFLENKSKFMLYPGITADSVVTMLCECIEKSNDGTVPISPGFYCSDYTFTTRFPRYLVDQGIWEIQN